MLCCRWAWFCVSGAHVLGEDGKHLKANMSTFIKSTGYRATWWIDPAQEMATETVRGSKATAADLQACDRPHQEHLRYRNELEGRDGRGAMRSAASRGQSDRYGNVQCSLLERRTFTGMMVSGWPEANSRRRTARTGTSSSADLVPR